MRRYLYVCLFACLGVVYTLASNDPQSRDQTSLHCKATPDDPSWPSLLDWAQLNSSIEGTLIKAVPAASSCYPGNPFGSQQACEVVTSNWGYSAYQATLPESTNYALWANNSCLPPNAPGYSESSTCVIGGAPQYIVNATSAEQVAFALKWASDRNLRVVVKGTGHDLNGRSSGAYSLSIWTHNFRSVSVDQSWRIPGGNDTAVALIAGSGNTWGSALAFALSNGRVAVHGVDETVGLGGFIQGGGHGPLSSTYGLSADQVLQATVVTTEGEILVANSEQNQDLFWAIRGGGGGQYGVVTEFVVQTYPAPTNIVASSIYVATTDLNETDTTIINATWDAFSALMANVPDLMDAGVAGSGIAVTGRSAQNTLGLPSPPPGVIVSLNLWSVTMPLEGFASVMKSVGQAMLDATGSSGNAVTITVAEPSVSTNYTAFFKSMNSSPSLAGSGGISSSRLLGRTELSDLESSQLKWYLQQIMVSREEGAGSMLVIGLQGGPGPRNTPENRRGALNPVWRSAYVHVIASGISADPSSSGTPGRELRDEADWAEANKESVWREWARQTGAYMNEANPYDGEWQHDFYGESYPALLEVKAKYDLSESLFVLAGVGSELWNYDMDTGKLCKRVG